MLYMTPCEPGEFAVVFIISAIYYEKYYYAIFKNVYLDNKQ